MTSIERYNEFAIFFLSTLSQVGVLGRRNHRCESRQYLARIVCRILSLESLFLSLFLFTLVSVHICLSRSKCNYTRLAINNLVISRQKHNTQRRQPLHAFSNVRERQCFLNKLTGNAWPVTRLSNEIQEIKK